MEKQEAKRPQWKKFLKQLGPGLITGASDDDPSGIVTYTQAGARFGPFLLWTALFTYPLMVVVQEMCARIGLVTRHGLAGTIRQYYPKWVLYMVVLISAPSIIMNIGADIAGMGAVANLLFPKIPSYVFSILFTIALLYMTIAWNYHRIATALKWLCISLLAYILIPFLTHTDWPKVIRHTIIPTWKNDTEYWMALVGILGTTISPYLFFWQASMEVEEVNQRHLVVDKRIMLAMESDVRTGMLLTNLVFFFIILAASNVLNNAGIFQVDTVEDAAKALQPLAGNAAYLLFALGVMGTGCLAIPVLGGALSYMIAETFNLEQGLDKKFHEAKGFYGIMAVSLFLGLAMQTLGISPVKALIYTAILYGITAPILIAIILLICNNKNIMGPYTNSRMSNIMGVLTFLLMATAAVALLYYYFH
ncbi:divalent metal cation transporter [Flavihumibacter rivuli]|uniref:NRAMP family divalent metal transporter n=1 Tax=Flavihumibacter rivuli TaxID=2838156 RepID=UPI001BDE9C6F|nr:divalent metal cation transporter [Flavihumibacter rivuli]ULQ56868.1 divalent metal cation transporter [Flavihumibacter rivuli]